MFFSFETSAPGSAEIMLKGGANYSEVFFDIIKGGLIIRI